MIDFNNLPSTEALTASAVQMYQAGEYLKAIKYCKQLIAHDPNHYEVLNLLGLSFFRLGIHDQAEKTLIKSATVQPLKSDAYCNLGLVYKSLNQYQLALNNFDKAIELDTPHFQAYFNRGLVLQVAQQYDLAIESFKKALLLNPNNLEIIFCLANSFFSFKQYEEAIHYYDDIIQSNPAHAQALNNRGVSLKIVGKSTAALDSFNQAVEIEPQYADAYNNRGSVYFELGQYQEAIQNYAKAISLKSNFAQAYFNLGMAQEAILDVNGALESYQSALSITPNYPEVFNNLGVLMQKQNRLQDSLNYLNQALTLAPKNFEALNNRAVTYQNLAQFDKALADLNLANQLNPDFAQAYVNKGMIYLLQGKLKEGFQLYEWRWNNAANLVNLATTHITQPLWTGKESLEGKVLLLTGEQGLGDVIQFSRYAKLASALGAHVILESQPALTRLLQDTFGEPNVITKGLELLEFDFYCPLLTLPLIFGTTIDSIPSEDSYLRVNPNKIAEWSGCIGNKKRLRVGLAWAGSKTHHNNLNRNLTISSLIKYLPNDVNYISLQKDISLDDKNSLKESGLDFEFYEEYMTDLSETAALIDYLDLVISVDTSVAHLSAAIGKKTWILLPFVPDWRWLLNRNDSPWYPSVHLYRQEKLAQWDQALLKLSTDLKKMQGQFSSL